MERPTARTRRARKPISTAAHSIIASGAAPAIRLSKRECIRSTRWAGGSPSSPRHRSGRLSGSSRGRQESPASPQRASPSDERQTESVFAPSSRRARANAIPSWLLPPVMMTGPLKSNFMPPPAQDPPQQGACLRPSAARRTARRTGSPPHRVEG